jgi:hypothetical protein
MTVLVWGRREFLSHYKSRLRRSEGRFAATGRDYFFSSSLYGGQFIFSSS